MQRFHFSLARALDWRRLQQRTEEEALAILLAERDALERTRAALEDEADHLQAEPRPDGSLSVQELAATDVYRKVLRRRVGDLLRRSDDCDERIRSQRTRILEAQRRVRLLERLETKQRHEWQVAFDREQENLAAELYLARWPRASRENP